MIKTVLLVALLYSIHFANPYKNLDQYEKINLFTNYFLNETLTSKLPPLPQREKPAEHEYNYEPTKYELYYNYVQRIKAIQDALAQEQLELDEKYEADIYKYNKKLKALFKYYKQDKNLFPIFTESFNKAFKAIYGKPILTIAKADVGIQFFLSNEPIYNKNKLTPIPIEFNYGDEKRLFNFYEKCEVSVTFEYNDNSITYDEVVCEYEDNFYQGKINLKNSEKIKLDVKINDDIFQQIIFGDKTNE